MEFTITAATLKGALTLAILATLVCHLVSPKAPKSLPGFRFLFLAIDIVCGLSAGFLYLVLETLG